MSNNFLIFKESIIGREHIIKKIENQDSVFSQYNSEENMHICAVADGHGSKSHPFSRIGSEKAVNLISSLFNITSEDDIKKQIVKEWQEEIFKDVDNNLDKVLDKVLDKDNMDINSWKSYSLNMLKDNFEKTNKDDGFNKKIKSKFIERWIEKGFPAKRKRTFDEYIQERVLRLYGTTLLVAKVGPEFTEIFQLGDGDVTFLDNENNYHRVFESNKNRNETTDSLCMNNAEDFFMYKKIETNSYSMLSLSTDGLLDAVKKGKGHKELFLDFKDMIIDNPNHFEKKALRNKLEEITNKGPKGDDTSIVILFEKKCLLENKNEKKEEDWNKKIEVKDSQLVNQDKIKTLIKDVNLEKPKIIETLKEEFLASKDTD